LQVARPLMMQIDSSKVVVIAPQPSAWRKQSVAAAHLDAWDQVLIEESMNSVFGPAAPRSAVAKRLTRSPPGTPG